MIPEIRKSVNATLYERTTSPLYGAMILSWCIWNWRIIYLTLFVDKEQIYPFHKIDYIRCNYWDIDYLIYYPLISTVGLLTIVPLFAIGAYWLELWFTEKKVKWKEHSERDRRLTIDQAAALRNEILETEQRYSKRIETKDDEISLLNAQVKQLTDAAASERPQKFRILYARYGYADKTKDVTLRVTSLLMVDGEFVVDNEILQEDPAPGIKKELVLIYEFETQITAIEALEEDTIILKDNKIKVTKTTSNVQPKNRNLDKLVKLMAGEWKLTYVNTATNGKGGERVTIDSTGAYYANGRHTFNLQVGSVNIGSKNLTFNKVALNGNLHSIELLRIVNANLIEGNDDQGYKLTYEKTK